MFRKDLQAREEWSPEAVARCAERQREILRDVWPALRPGGYLVYSTCTFNREENEDVVQYACDELGAELIPHPDGPRLAHSRRHHGPRPGGLSFLPPPHCGRGFVSGAAAQNFGHLTRRTADGGRFATSGSRQAAQGLRCRGAAPRTAHVAPRGRRFRPAFAARWAVACRGAPPTPISSNAWPPWRASWFRASPWPNARARSSFRTRPWRFPPPCRPRPSPRWPSRRPKPAPFCAAKPWCCRPTPPVVTCSPPSTGFPSVGSTISARGPTISTRPSGDLRVGGV